MPGVMNGYRNDEYDPYGRRADPYGRQGDPNPYRRPDMYDRQVDDRYRSEPLYSTSSRDRRDDSRKPTNGYGPARDNGFTPTMRESGDDYRSRDKDRYRTGEPETMGGEPQSYDLDHLATFTVSQNKGELMTPKHGVEKLRQMEMTCGIWTMRVQLMVDAENIIILDKQTGQEIERFSLKLVTDPMAVTNRDRRDIYNNIVLFTVREDSRRDSPTEMHIFQCVAKPAQNIVDEILESKEGRGRPNSHHTSPPHRDSHSREQDFLNAQRSAQAAEAYTPGPQIARELRKSIKSPDADNESVLSDRTDQDVMALPVIEQQQLLNHCFDDIERFVGRLQQAAEAYKELDRRKKPKNKHGSHDGMLSMRARPPPAKDFIDIFQKFKLSFNLLAKLKPHIHDPNAPELVHFLFTPMSLVVEASKDPRNNTPDLASQVVSPLLTADAVDLLYNCLTSKESDLWRSLGRAWTTPKDKWKEYVPPYFPRFSDGWQPAPSGQEPQQQQHSSRRDADYVSQPQQHSSRRDADYDHHDDRQSPRYEDRYEPRPYPSHKDSRELYRHSTDNRDLHEHRPRDSPYRKDSREDMRDERIRNQGRRDPYEEDDMFMSSRPPPEREADYRSAQPSRSRPVSPGPLGVPNPPSYGTSLEMGADPQRAGLQHSSNSRGMRGASPGRERVPSPRPMPPLSYEEEQRRFRDSLLRSNAKCYEVIHDRQGKNSKELNVRKGEILEVLDDSKNWWKLRNAKGDTGHAPYTIIQAYGK